MDRNFFCLGDEQFSRLEPLLPAGTRGKPRGDDRRVISGIVHVLKSGGRWADAPEVYGPRKTLHNRFVRWVAKGRLDEHLPDPGRGERPAGAAADQFLGGKTHRSASGGKGGA